MVDDADRLLVQAYDALTFVRRMTPPGLWDEPMTELYLEIESHLNASPTGTIRRPNGVDAMSA